MPLINGKYYANPQYGLGLERARVADEEFRRVHGEPEPSWHDHFYGFADGAAIKTQGKNTVSIQAQSDTQNHTDRAAMSYSEKVDGSVAEHEAIQSTVMNRVASGQKQYVGKGKPVDEHNVIHAPHQYQGVRGPNFLKYTHGTANEAGARNATKADEDLRRTGKPTNDATSFIVNPRGTPPTARQVHRLGNVTPAGHVGDVYLYKPAPHKTKH